MMLKVFDNLRLLSIKSTKKSAKSVYRTIINMTIIMVLLCFSVFFVTRGFGKAVASAADAYGEAKDNTKVAVEQEWYDKGYSDGKEDYHTTNEVSIAIENIRETENLQVLRVRDIVYIDSDIENVVYGISGSGEFYVNLKAGEYIIDDEHGYVLARISKPVLGEIAIDHSKYSRYDFSSTGERIEEFFVGNIADGVRDAKNVESKACEEIFKDICGNEQYFSYAENAAKEAVSSLIKSFNITIPDLIVDVEFYDD